VQYGFLTQSKCLQTYDGVQDRHTDPEPFDEAIFNQLRVDNTARYIRATNRLPNLQAESALSARENCSKRIRLTPVKYQDYV
jgi:hypothetical protein